MKIINRQAVEAQKVLQQMLTLNLPMADAFKIALLSNKIDTQVIVFAKVRDQLLKTYKVKVGVADEKEGSVTFSTLLDSFEDKVGEEAKQAALEEFILKINDLTATEGEDIPIKIKLPSSLTTTADALKPIARFVDMEEA